MGKIWLQTPDGKQIHLPVVGADVNTPDSPVKIPTTVLVTQNRCLSGQVQVTTPTGTITLDFSAPGRTGSCIQCGQCCTHPIANCPDAGGVCGYVLDSTRGIHKCQYLTINKIQGKDGLGKANGTECSIRATILGTFKGCTLFPGRPEEKAAWMTACGFTFG